MKREAALSTERIYFVDENGKKLQPTAEAVNRGERPSRFKGILDRLPEPGHILRSPEGSFVVLKIEHELRISIKAPPKIFIVVTPK